MLEYERESDKDWEKRVWPSFEIGPQQLQKEHAIWSKVKMSTDILSEVIKLRSLAAGQRCRRAAGQ